MYYEHRSPISLNNNMYIRMMIDESNIRIPSICVQRVVCIHMNIWIIIIYGRAHVPGSENDWPQTLSMNWKLENFSISFQPTKFTRPTVNSSSFFEIYCFFRSFRCSVYSNKWRDWCFSIRIFFSVGFRIYEIRATDGNEFSLLVFSSLFWIQWKLSEWKKLEKLIRIKAPKRTKMRGEKNCNLVESRLLVR